MFQWYPIPPEPFCFFNIWTLFLEYPIIHLWRSQQVRSLPLPIIQYRSIYLPILSASLFVDLSVPSPRRSRRTLPMKSFSIPAENKSIERLDPGRSSSCSGRISMQMATVGSATTAFHAFLGDSLLDWITGDRQTIALTIVAWIKIEMSYYAHGANDHWNVIERELFRLRNERRFDDQWSDSVVFTIQWIHDAVFVFMFV